MPPFFYARLLMDVAALKGGAMSALRILFRRNFALALALLAVALLVRAAVPEGWMPQSDRGTVTVRLCTAAGTVEIPLPGKRAPEPDHERGQQPCAFGGLAHASSPPAPAAILPLPEPTAEQYGHAHASFIFAQAARQMPPARAPPAKA